MTIKAHSMNVAVWACGCGHVLFTMLDDAGNEVAEGCVPPGIALALCQQIVDALDPDDGDGLDGAEVAGHC